MDHDYYWGFARFWWLIFPLFWMIVVLAWGWSRHARANRTLDIIKSYADQGKDPPPELMKNLRGDMDGGCGPYAWRYSPERRLHRAFLFLALAIAFGVLMIWNYNDSGHWHHHFGLLVPTVIFAALAFSNFLSLLFLPRGWPPRDRDER